MSEKSLAEFGLSELSIDGKKEFGREMLIDCFRNAVIDNNHHMMNEILNGDFSNEINFQDNPRDRYIEKDVFIVSLSMHSFDTVILFVPNAILQYKDVKKFIGESVAEFRKKIF